MARVTAFCCDARCYNLVRDPWAWGRLDEAPRVHHVARRRGYVAACGARAAATGDAGGRIPPPRVLRHLRRPTARISPGPEGGGLRRGRECGDRISLGREPIRSTFVLGCRIGSSTG